MPGVRAAAKSPSVGMPLGRSPLPAFHRSERTSALGQCWEGLVDRDHNHCLGLLAVDSKTLLQDRIDTDPGPPVDPIGFVRPGDQEDQCDARVLHHVFDAVDPIVAAPVRDQQCAAVVLDLDEARLVAFGLAVELPGCPLSPG